MNMDSEKRKLDFNVNKFNLESIWLGGGVSIYNNCAARFYCACAILLRMRDFIAHARFYCACTIRRDQSVILNML